MPTAAPRPCTYACCGKLVLGGSRCEQHRRLDTNRFGDRRRGSRHERGYGTAWDKQRKRILERDCGLCQPCKRRGWLTQATMVDHIVPKAEGGSDDDTNLQSICGDCHGEKTAAEAARARGRG